MKVKIRFLSENQNPQKPYAVIIDEHDNQVIIGPVNDGVDVKEGEEVDIFFKCKKRGKCGYPFCGSSCEGNDGFYVFGREERGY